MVMFRRPQAVDGRVVTSAEQRALKNAFYGMDELFCYFFPPGETINNVLKNPDDDTQREALLKNLTKIFQKFAGDGGGVGERDPLRLLNVFFRELGKWMVHAQPSRDLRRRSILIELLNRPDVRELLLASIQPNTNIEETIR